MIARSGPSDEIGETVGLKGRQVRNYIRLTYLIPEILDMVDQKKIQFVSAVDLSYLEEQIQKWVLNISKIMDLSKQFR